jgi:hypothetical protein
MRLVALDASRQGKSQACWTHLFVLALERVVVANNAHGLGAILVRLSHAVRHVAEPSKVLLHIQNVAVDVHALKGGTKLQAAQPPIMTMVTSQRSTTGSLYCTAPRTSSWHT